MIFDSDGVALHYTSDGSGPPVVLLHGALLDIETNWRHPGTVDALAPEFRVVALDARGHGRSDRPHEEAAYGRHLATDVVRLLDHLEIETAHLVGYSMGGDVALNLIDTAPERLRSLVVAGSGWLQPETVSHFVYEWLARALSTVEPGGSAFDVLRRPAELAAPPYRDVIDRNDPVAVTALARRMLALAVAEPVLRACRVPTLALVGEADREARPDVDAMHAVLPGLRVTVLPGLNHQNTFQAPAFARVIGSFLRETDAGSPEPHPRRPSAETAT